MIKKWTQDMKIRLSYVTPQKNVVRAATLGIQPDDVSFLSTALLSQILEAAMRKLH